MAGGDSGIPGVFPHQLAEWWERGAGAAKIRWGDGGDFDRCVRLAVEEAHMDPERAKGFCAERHHAALGIWPATHAAMDKHAGRAGMATDTRTTPHGNVTGAPAAAGRAEYMRFYPLEDIHIIRSSEDGGTDGRTVEAYAAVFNQRVEIQDHQGHYYEENDPASFSRTIDHIERGRGSFGAVKVLYNHGMTIQGTPSERFSIPIGVPVLIKPEARGVLTRTRYSKTPLADEILESVIAGSVTAQSYTGRIIRSDPDLRPGDRYRPLRGSSLPVVRRLELGLREYGPVLWPAYSGAEILGVRMSTPGGDLDPDEEPDDASGTPPDEGPAAGDPLARPDGDEHSARYHQHQLYALRSQEQREKAGLVW